jgi:hypothetical protein
MAEKLTGRHKAMADEYAREAERDRRPAAEDERRVDREIARRAQEERYAEKTRKDAERFQRAGKKAAEDRKYEEAADTLAHNRKLRQKEEEEQKTKERAENLISEAKELVREQELDAEQKKLFEAQERRQRATAGLRKRPQVDRSDRFFGGGFDYSRGIAKVKATRKKVATKRKVTKKVPKKAEVTAKSRPVSKSTLTGGRTEGPSGVFKDVWKGSEAEYLAGKIRAVQHKKPKEKVATVVKAKGTQRDPKTGRFISTGATRGKRVVTSKKLMLNYKPFKEWVDSRKVSKETKARYWRDWQQFHGKAKERFWVTFHVEGVDDRGDKRNFNFTYFMDSRNPSRKEIEEAREELKLQYDYLKVTKFFVLRSRELIGGEVRYHV